MRSGEGDDPAAVLTADKLAAGSHEPVHLEVHGSEEVPEAPTRAQAGRRDRAIRSRYQRNRVAKLFHLLVYGRHCKIESVVEETSAVRSVDAISYNALREIAFP